VGACDGFPRRRPESSGRHLHGGGLDQSPHGCQARPHGWAITGFSRSPSLSISMRTVDPASRQRGGSIANPTPAGAPVAMIVPGNMVNAVDRWAMISQQLVIICFVDAS